jgi:hypothetical protein
VDLPVLFSPTKKVNGVKGTGPGLTKHRTFFMNSAFTRVWIHFKGSNRKWNLFYEDRSQTNQFSLLTFDLPFTYPREICPGSVGFKMNSVEMKTTELKMFWRLMKAGGKINRRV